MSSPFAAAFSKNNAASFLTSKSWSSSAGIRFGMSERRSKLPAKPASL